MIFSSRLNSDHHVARYCRPSTCSNGKISKDAFLPRENEVGVSVNWLEYFRGHREIQIDRIRRDVSKQLKIKENGRFAVLQIHSIESAHESMHVWRNLWMRFAFWQKNPSHAEIRGWPEESLNGMIAAFLANRVADEDIFPAK